MTPALAPAVPPEDPSFTAWSRETLREIIGVEMRLARVLDGEVAAFAEAPRTEESPRTIERLARVVHQTARGVRLGLVQHERTGEEREIRLRRLVADAERAEEARAAREIAHRRDLARAVIEQVVESQHGEPHLGYDAREKVRRAAILLEREAADRETFLERPVGAIIARLCRRLGLRPDWSRWDGAWVAAARAATPPEPPPARATARSRAIPKPAVAEPAVAEPEIPESSVSDPAVPEPAVPEPAIPEPDLPESAVSDPAVPEPTLLEARARLARLIARRGDRAPPARPGEDAVGIRGP